MKNVLLLAMSTLDMEKIKDNYYIYEGGKVFAGQSQLEPVTHMLSVELGKKGERLDKIIILETWETRKAKEGKKSAVEFYKERVKRFLDSDFKDSDFVDIPIDENEPAVGIADATGVLLREYAEQKKNNDKMNFWIDTQGGFRDVAMVFNAIISLLREQEIEPRGIYSIRYFRDNTESNPCPIVDQTKRYNIFKFVSAMQEFMDYGKAKGFKAYYGEENRFVQAIAGIADAIQMCQPQKFEDAVRKFAEYLKSGDYKDDDPYLRIFVEFMKSDYGVLLERPDNIIEQIRWCVKKEFYQQAMTIYIEKMPEYYYNRGIFELPAGAEAGKKYGKNPYADTFYERMFDEMLTDEDDKVLNTILTSVAEYDEVNEKKKAISYLMEELQKEESENVKKAINSVIEDIERDFDDNGERKEHAVGEAKKIRGYINGLCNDSGKGRRYKLLYGTSIPKTTYEKKKKAIENAKVKNPELAKIMEYYLAMKLLRNRMNHASEDDIDGEERKVIDFLESEQVDLGIRTGQDEMGLDYQKVKKLILQGLDLLPVQPERR